MTANAGFSSWDSQALSRALFDGTLSADDYISGLEQLLAQKEPTIQALVFEENRPERIRKQLQHLLDQRTEDKKKPPLFGLPVAVKDIFRVDGHETRAGCSLPSHLFLGQQAKAVNRLRKAGAIILGKSVTAEFAYLSPGPTSNPLAPGHTPGGSSSGSAAAVAAGYCPIALGTQTVGSINRPAAYCGVIGFKPSYGAISSEGVIPLAPACDHVGVLARDMPSLIDSAAVLMPKHAIKTALPDDSPKPDLLIPEGPYLDHTDSDARAHFEDVIRFLQSSGYRIKRVPVFEDFQNIFTHHHNLVAYQAAQVHAAWFAHYSQHYHAETRQLIETGRLVEGHKSLAAQESQKQQRQRLEQLLQDHSAQLWISPSTTSTAPEGLHATGNSVMQLPWTHAGLPLLNLNAGQLRSLPIGVQFAAAFNTDAALLHWGIALEACLGQFATAVN